MMSQRRVGQRIMVVMCIQKVSSLNDPKLTHTHAPTYSGTHAHMYATLESHVLRATIFFGIQYILPNLP